MKMLSEETSKGDEKKNKRPPLKITTALRKGKFQNIQIQNKDNNHSLLKEKNENSSIGSIKKNGIHQERSRSSSEKIHENSNHPKVNGKIPEKGALRMIHNFNWTLMSNINYLKIMSVGLGLSLSKSSIFIVHSRTKYFWDCLMFFVIIWNFMTIPLMISFDISISDHPNLLIMEVFIEAVLILDLIISVVIRRIQKKTNASNQEIDSLSTGIKICLDVLVITSRILVKTGWPIYLKLLFFLKFLQYNDFFFKTHRAICSTSNIEVFLAIGKFTLNSLITSHLLACGWHAAAFFNNKSLGRTWIDAESLNGSDWERRYFKSFYLGISALCVSGAFQVDFSPANDREVILAIFSTPLAPLWLFYLFQTVKQALPFEEKEDRRKRKILNEFLKNNKIRFPLALKSKHYLEKSLKYERRAKILGDTEVLKMISDEIRKELSHEAYLKFLKKNPLLRVLTDKTLIELLSKLHRKVFKPGEEIAKITSKDQRKNLYLIQAGQVEIRYQKEIRSRKTDKITCKKEGEMFGEEYFFSKVDVELSASSVLSSSILCIDWADMMTILSDFPEDYEKFCFVRDKALLYEDYGRNKYHCKGCDKVEHHHKKCPINFKRKVKEIFYKKLMQHFSQSRRKYARVAKKKFHAMNNKENYTEVCAMFQYNSAIQRPRKKKPSTIVQYQISEIEPKYEVSLKNFSSFKSSFFFLCKYFKSGEDFNEEIPNFDEKSKPFSAQRQDVNFFNVENLKKRILSKDFDLSSREFSMPLGDWKESEFAERLGSFNGTSSNNLDFNSPNDLFKEKLQKKKKVSRKDLESDRFDFYSDEISPLLEKRFSISFTEVPINNNNNNINYNNEEMKQNDSPLGIKTTIFDFEMDIMCTFKHYFPHNNIENILIKLKQRHDLKL